MAGLSSFRNERVEGGSGRGQLAERMDSCSSASPSESSPRRKENLELMKLFKLPDNETLVDDFICALRRKVLYQGRLYIFEHYVCFYSRIFNHQKILTIPLKDVTQVRKKKHYGFPNSLEVVWLGKRDVFTSFLKRDNAHKILSYAWSKSTPYAKVFGGVEGDLERRASPRHHSHTDSKKILGSVKLAKLVRGNQSEGNTPRSASTAGDGASDDEELQMYHTSKEGFEVASQASELQSHHDSDSDDDSDVTDSPDGAASLQPVSSPAPAPDPAATLLLEAQFDLSVQDFYKEFLSDQSQFFITWHEARGDTKVHLSEWHKHGAVGYVRELSFITPLKQRIGPSKCLCTQTQHVRLHPGEHLIFETSQIMDIPYGDHFSVEQRWDYTPVDDKKCKVECRLRIPFSKKTMFKSTIESSTKQLCKEASEDWVAAAERWLEPPIPIQPEVQSPPSVFASSGGNSSLETGEPTHFSRAQSLAMRLSSDLLPDMDILLRAPTAHRAEIARVLQLKRKESEVGIKSRLNSSRGRTGSMYFEAQDSSKTARERVVESVRLHPVFTFLLLFLLLLQVGYIVWQNVNFGTLAMLLPSLPRLWPARSPAGEVVPVLNPAGLQQSLPTHTTDTPGLEELAATVSALQAAVADLQRQLAALTDRLG